MKVMSIFGQQNSSAISDDECHKKLGALKQEMMKAFNYAEGW